MSGNFLGYLIGYVIAIIGVGYAMNAAGIGKEWIVATVLVLIGLGIVYALSRSQHDRGVSTHTERVVDPHTGTSQTRSTFDRT